MRYTEPEPESDDLAIVELGSTETQLRSEIEALKRQVEEQRRALDIKRASANGGHSVSTPPHPSRLALWFLGIAIVAIVVGAFVGGYLPRTRREALIGAEAHEQEQTLPVVSVVTASRAGAQSELVLPGNVQAVTESPVLARVDGYIKKRYADIGDRVTEGQVLAEIDTPDLDQQVDQGRASLESAQASLQQSTASYAQGKANMQLAKVTAERWQSLVNDGIVSKQDNDTYQAQYQAQTANLQALEKAIGAARSNVAVAEATLARYVSAQNFKMVRSPFSGVITVRNVDTGALVTTGNTLLFRVAQTDPLRIYINVPQESAGAVRAGQPALVRVTDSTNRRFTGTVTRTANALDPASRTLLTEVQVANANGKLLPGTYVVVDLDSTQVNRPLLLSSAALVVRSDGPQVAVVGEGHIVHFQHVQIGRDYGDRLEITGGLKEGDSVIVNPSDNAREGAKVSPVALAEKPAGK
jgi:RND family efflux transporter MFP subunit